MLIEGVAKGRERKQDKEKVCEIAEIVRPAFWVQVALFMDTTGINEHSK